MACCFVKSAVLRGTEALPITVEVDIQRGLPRIDIIGMPGVELMEAIEAARCAIRNAGFTVPNEKIVINLAPSSLKKKGIGTTAAIALGILAASGQIPREFVEGRLFAGELGLDGSMRPTRGTIAYAMAAKNEGLALVTSASCNDAVPIAGVEQLGMESLADARTGSVRPLPIPAASKKRMDGALALDFKDVRGNEVAKRALQIAAAGGHGILLVGAPGTGKTMLASRVPSILPPMSAEARIQAAIVHSAAGLPTDAIAAGVRPFRAPHHSASLAGMVGGGNPVMPGEVSLSHNGALFLGEIQEFRPAVLQGIRQSIDAGRVCIARADGITEMPAKPDLLIAAANPCPCGYYGDATRECTCSAQQIREYQNRLMGPLADCIDIQVDVRRVAPSELLEAPEGASSAELREGVMRARSFAAERNDSDGRPVDMADALGRCCLDREAITLLDNVVTVRSMSGLDIMRAAKVARTIADMEESYQVKRGHIAEALSLIPRFGNQ